MADATKTTARHIGHMIYTQAPAVYEKNVFHLFRFTQPVKNYSLNTKKSNFVIFHPHQKKLNHEVILKIFDNYTFEYGMSPPTKRSSAFPLFVPSSCLPINLLYFKAVAILMHDVLINLSPRNISNHFSSANVIHTYIQHNIFFSQ